MTEHVQAFRPFELAWTVTSKVSAADYRMPGVVMERGTQRSILKLGSNKIVGNEACQRPREVNPVRSSARNDRKHHRLIVDLDQGIHRHCEARGRLGQVLTSAAGQGLSVHLSEDSTSGKSYQYSYTVLCGSTKTVWSDPWVGTGTTPGIMDIADRPRKKSRVHHAGAPER